MKRKVISVLLIFAFLLSGCTSVTELTSEEEDLIAEYAAGMMIKKYKESKGIITTPDNQPVISETEAGTKNNTEEEIPSATGNAVENETGDFFEDETISSQTAVSTLEEVLNVKGVEISVIGYSVEERYPTEELSFSVEASTGHKLLVVEYDVWNSVDADAVMELDAKNVAIRAVINGSTKVNVFKTMLKNDLLNMNGVKFAPGEAKTGVLIFNISDELAENLTSVDVSATVK
ncbi:MAG: hypothetical protein PUF12_04615 [Thermoflexaceae bacterium]|nr:hypothetical protein [Thermoflexaceae bacterium]